MPNAIKRGPAGSNPADGSVAPFGSFGGSGGGGGAGAGSSGGAGYALITF